MGTPLCFSDWIAGTASAVAWTEEPIATTQPGHVASPAWKWSAAGLRSETFLSLVGIFTSPGSQPSLSYRLRGLDTLTIGDASYWIRAKMQRALLEGCWDRESVKGHAVLQYASLLNAVKSESAWPSTVWSVLDPFYGTCDARAVHDFLEANPRLTDLLVQAWTYLEKHFGPKPRVDLEIVRDPEVEGVAELVAHIMTSLSVNEALARLRQIDEEWFLDQLGTARGLFNMDLVFV